MLTFFAGKPMQKLLIGSIAAVGFFGAPALASDFPVKAPAYNAPITAPPYNWSGLYLGANIGGAFSSASANVAGTVWDPGATEFIGGASGPFSDLRLVPFGAKGASTD
jgi:hypothetical protein